jgi:hypothetical protein
MAKARLLQAVCAVALLAAAPAFAQQTTTHPATTGAGNSVNAPVDQTTPGPAGRSSMVPAERMDQTDSGMGSHSSHRSAMSGHAGMHARNDTSQNSAVDQLNDQSFQAAQRGQSFSASDTGSSATMSPGTMSPGTISPAPSGSNDMSGNSPVPAASGAGGGTGAK